MEAGTQAPSPLVPTMSAESPTNMVGLLDMAYKQGALSALTSLLEALEFANTAGMMLDLAGAIEAVKLAIEHLETAGQP